MTKRIRAKHKIDRRLGENIWGRPKSRSTAASPRPGQHGERRVQKLSDYGQQLKGQAEAQGLLRQPQRASVPPHLRRSLAPQGLRL